MYFKEKQNHDSKDHFIIAAQITDQESVQFYFTALKNPHFKFSKFIQLVPDHYKSASDSSMLTRTAAALTGQQKFTCHKDEPFHKLKCTSHILKASIPEHCWYFPSVKASSCRENP